MTLVYKRMHDFLEISMIFFFFFFFNNNDGGFFFFFLKMHEAWVNAPSLEHKSMSLEKNLI